VKPAIFQYVYFSCLIARCSTGIHAIPLALSSIFIANYFIVSWRQLSQFKFAHSKIYASIHQIGLYFITGILIFLQACLILNTCHFYYHNPDFLSYKTSFGQIEAMASKLSRLSCNLPSVKLGVFPAEPYLYAFTKMKPMSKYIYYWPWVAEIARNEVLSHMETDTAIVYLFVPGNIWGISYSTFLGDLYRYLASHYTYIGDNCFATPILLSNCDVIKEKKIPPNWAEYFSKGVDKNSKTISKKKVSTLLKSDK
jgi:hypothetical protein